MERLLEFLSDLFLSIYKALVDAIVAFWPSTPDEYTIGAMLSNLPTDSFAFYFVMEAADVVIVVVSLVAIYKLIKILPLT